MIGAIRCIAAVAIKGLGPAVANLLLFIPPTLVALFNTAEFALPTRAFVIRESMIWQHDHRASLHGKIARLKERHLAGDGSTTSQSTLHAT